MELQQARAPANCDSSGTYQGLSFLARALFACAQSAKVFDRLGDRVTKETHHDASTLGCSFNLDIEVDLVGNLFQFAERGEASITCSELDRPRGKSQTTTRSFGSIFLRGRRKGKYCDQKSDQGSGGKKLHGSG